MSKQKAETKSISKEALNKVIVHVTERKNGTRRVQQDFSNCPTMTEQHTGHLTDLNYLIKKYKPDELAAYLAARNQHRREILNHDFSAEPSLQEANNIIYRSKQEFNNLDPEIRKQFPNHVEFLKFIDNPKNAEKLIKLGILTKDQVQVLQADETPAADKTTPTTPKKEEKKE